MCGIDYISIQLLLPIFYLLTSVALRMLDSVESSTSAAIAAALAHRPQDLSIYSNSWGYRTSGMYVASTHDAIAAVIYSGIKNVRKPHTGSTG